MRSIISTFVIMSVSSLLAATWPTLDLHKGPVNTLTAQILAKYTLCWSQPNRIKVYQKRRERTLNAFCKTAETRSPHLYLRYHSGGKIKGSTPNAASGDNWGCSHNATLNCFSMTVVIYASWSLRLPS